jgi:hypothetical protein
MVVSVQKAASYLAAYVRAYRDEYDHMTNVGEYPKFEISSYLHANLIICTIASDGWILVEQSRHPSGSWWIAGGPAICVDYEKSREPIEIAAARKQVKATDSNSGIWRVISDKTLPPKVWYGRMPAILETEKLETEVGTIVCHRVGCSTDELIRRVTFGALANLVPFSIVHNEGFWFPAIVRNIGFFNAERSEVRFFSYIEASNHLDEAAWDLRTISVRIRSDLRRDFIWSFLGSHKVGSFTGGIFSAGPHQHSDRQKLFGISDDINGFTNLLQETEAGNESVFHQYLLEHSSLLDVYAEVISKPRFKYPNTQDSPLGKAYVEPDFVLRYPDGTYKLVELERPSKSIATAQGHPRAEFTQASFQIAEWRDYLSKHYNVIKDQFPGLTANVGGILVIGRSTEKALRKDSRGKDYKSLLRIHLSNTEVYTYDDLLERAIKANFKMSSLL